MTSPVYAFDPHGTNPDNMVVDETHALPSVGANRRIIIPNFAPFYYRDFKIMVGGAELNEGVDFFFGNRYREASHGTAQDIFGSLWIINDSLTGDVTFEYRALGSDYTITRQRATTYIATNPNVISDDWEIAMNEERFFPVVVKIYDRDNWQGEQEVIAGIDEITSVIDSKMTNGDKNTLHELIVKWLSDLQDVITASDFQDHITRDGNLHGLQWFEVDALKQDGIAADTKKAYGKSLAELVSYINSRSITHVDLDEYVSRVTESNITGDIRLKDGLAFLSVGPSNNSDRLKTVVDLSRSVWKLFTDINLKYVADSDKNGTGKVTLKSGRNVLELVSNGTAQDKDALRINGQTVLTKANLDDHVSGDNVQVRLHVSNTSSVKLTGDGSTANPIRAELVEVPATTGAMGTFELGMSETDRSNDKAAVPWLLNQIRKRLLSKIPTTRTINGQATSSDIVLTKLDLDLENVVNLSDADMPVNDNHTAILNTLADSGHGHNWIDLGFKIASTTQTGLGQLIDTSRNAEEEGAVVASSKVKEYHELSLVQEQIVEDSLPIDALNLQQYGGIERTNVSSSFTGWVFSILEEVKYFYRGVYFDMPIQDFDLETLFASNYQNNTFYLYVTSNTVTAEYSMTNSKLADDDGRILIATVVTGPTSIRSGTVERVTRLGNFREFDEHVKGDIFHGIDFSKLTADYLGLAGLYNGEVYSELQNIPQSEGEKTYASRRLMSESYGGLTRFVVVSGIANCVDATGLYRQTLPLPEGFVYSDCNIIIIPCKQTDSMGGWMKGRMKVVEGAGGTAELQVGGFYTNNGNQYGISMTMHFAIIADHKKRAERLGL